MKLIVKKCELTKIDIFIGCYRHNLAEPEGGPRTRWAQKMHTISLRIGSYAGVWRVLADNIGVT
jgi:hypothetical protein